MTLPLFESYREIPLTHGLFALVSTADYEFLMQWKWHAYWHPRTKSFYAVRSSSKKYTCARMHRVLLNPPDDVQVDHINHDTLDNRRCNLRLATASQNCQNRRKRCDNTSGYKGVFWFKVPQKWGVITALNGKRKYLGIYPSREEAARAYDTFARENFGEFALLNFPHVAHHPGPV